MQIGIKKLRTGQSKKWVLLPAVVAVGLSSVDAQANAKPSTPLPPSTPPTCSSNGLKTPFPVRPVVVTTVGTQAFNLPNGSTINMAADLKTMLITTLSNSSVFSAADPNPLDPCNSHIEIRAAVTAFQLDIAGMSVSFGYKSDGKPINSSIGINSSASVSVGRIDMDFSVWNCTNGQCSSVAASTAKSQTVTGSVSVTLDFGTISTSPGLVFNSALAPILRKIMSNGIDQLAKAPKVNELPWQSIVQEYDKSTGTVYLGVGSRSNIGVNQSFVVYAAKDSTPAGVCNVYKAVANIHTTSVSTVGSTAVVDQLAGGAAILPGDVVMILNACASQ